MIDNMLCTGDKKIYISKKCYSNLLLDGVAIKILKQENPHSFHISFQKIYITYIIGLIIN